MNQADPAKYGITNPNQNFSQWYTDLGIRSRLFAYGPTRGTIIILPYGLKLWHQIKTFVARKFQQHGVEEAYFPMLIPHDLFAKEQAQIAGFNPEIMAVTQVGSKHMDQPWYLRPTSETVICDYLHKVVHSYRDLPIKLNQWCSVVRWEKNPRPFLRSNEFLWQELHAAFASAQAARTFCNTIHHDVYYCLLTEFLKIPVFAGLKSEGEKFPGACATWTLEAVMPNGEVLQCGTSHYFGTKISTGFNLAFVDAHQKQKLIHYVSAGVSMRLLGAVIMIHGDERGLVLPFALAPVQFMFLILKPSVEITRWHQQLARAVFATYRIQTVMLDGKNYGKRVAEWEVQGIPFLVVIGQRDYDNKTVMIQVRRSSNSSKQIIPQQELGSKLPTLIQLYQKTIFNRALHYQNQYITHFKTTSEFAVAINHRHVIAKQRFCNRKPCETQIKFRFGYTARTLISLTPQSVERCFFCSHPSQGWFFFGKAY